MQPNPEYLQHLREGRFLIQRSASNGCHVFYPRTLAPGTGADDLEWVAASGNGTVYSATVIYPKPPAKPYVVVLVDLDEGVRMMSRVDGIDPEAVEIGMRVRARIVEEHDDPFVVFDPA